MTTEEAVLKGVVYGGVITLIGTLFSSCVQILLQWLQQKWAINTEKKKGFAEKRLGALQGAVQLCDFLHATSIQTPGPRARDTWSRIRNETLASGALLPQTLQSEFRDFLTETLLIDNFEALQRSVNRNAVERIRAKCVSAIQEEFEK